MIPQLEVNMASKNTDCAACDKNNNSLPTKDIAKFASTGNLPGTLGASFGLALDTNTAGKVGNRLGAKSPVQLMSFIETPGTNKQKSAMSSGQKKSHLINSVGLGNFSLNSTFETGLIGSIASSRGASSNFLKGSSTGSSLMAASSLGIGVPGGDMLGIGSNDSAMFKIFKLAAFGLRLLCAALRDKQRGGPGGYNSDTEELLGLILSLGIDLSLLERLKSIFDKLLALFQPNFASFGVSDLNIANSLFDLCDWVENMEYGSNTLDTLKGSLPGGFSNKTLTEMAGKKLIGEGTYDTYAKNDFPFDQQFKSIAGDVDALKCDACKLGKANLTVANQGTNLFNVEFDPRTGLNRETGFDKIQNNTPSIVVESGVDYISETDEITFDEEGDEIFLANNNNIDIADKLTKPALAGTDTLHVTNPSQFPIDSWVEIGEGTDTAECAMCVEYGSLKLKSPLKNSHMTGTSISPPSNSSPCGPGKQIKQIKKDTKVTSTEYSQKSITSQVFEENKKIKNDTPLKKISGKKTISEQLGEPPLQTEQSDKITTTLDETKTLEKDENTKLTPSTTKQELKNKIKKSATETHDITEATDTTKGISYKTDTDEIVYDTYKDETGNYITNTYEKKTGEDSFEKTKTETKATKPYGGPPAEPGDTEVKCYHTGETIKQEDLRGTVMEDADINAVALLHPNDRENLKNTEEVNKTLKDAETVWDETFETEIEKTENLVLEQQSSGIIFGVQLPEVLNGNQIVMNSERVLISAKTQEVGIFAKRKFFVTTDDEITMNCKQRFVVKTDTHASIEAPSVHLGTYTTKNHPSLKGDCVMWWMNDLCDWLSGHTHSDPFITTGSPTQQGSLAGLKARTPTLLSERIFISG